MISARSTKRGPTASWVRGVMPLMSASHSARFEFDVRAQPFSGPGIQIFHSANGTPVVGCPMFRAIQGTEFVHRYNLVESQVNYGSC